MSVANIKHCLATAGVARSGGAGTLGLREAIPGRPGVVPNERPLAPNGELGADPNLSTSPN